MRRALAVSLVALAFASLLGGCASVRISREGVTMVEAEITGWYLFDFIPIGSGDPKNPNGSTCRLFCDNTTVQHSLELVDWALKREHADFVDDLNTYTTDEYVFIIFLRRHAIHTSAKLVKMAPIRETFVDAEPSDKNNRGLKNANSEVRP